MHDVIIIGAGAAATAAALEFCDRGIRPVVLDVGYEPDERTRVVDNFYEFRAASDSFDLMIGQDLQGLSNLLTKRRVPVKLTTPSMDYVTRDAERLAPIDESDFCAVQSFARGGLANAWGAGLYRFSTEDMSEFPIEVSDIDPYLDKLTREIGIGGMDDDLTPFFGPTNDLQSPIRLSDNVAGIYNKYNKKRASFGQELRIGHSRTAVLTENKNGRPPVEYKNLEFWQEQPSLYTPRITLDRLIAEKRIDYRDGMLAERWTETADGIQVEGRDLNASVPFSVGARRLLVAAGVINTTKITLASLGDYETQLPLLENPAVQIPLVLPASIGRALNKEAFGLVQLNLIWRSPDYESLLQGSIMEITSPMRAEFFASLPYAARSNLGLIRNLLPGMLVMQIYWPGSSQRPAMLSLQENGRLRIDGHPNSIDLHPMKRLFGHLRKLGAWTHPALAARVPTGHAIHYAGTLPMRRSPASYECDPSGRLHGTSNVFIGDSASFTALPAKNMSFSMMANAMRVASHIAHELGGSE